MLASPDLCQKPKYHYRDNCCRSGVFLPNTYPCCTRHRTPGHETMKVIVKRWQAIAQWRWDTGQAADEGDEDSDVCGICRVAFEGCCPTCKMPGDDCPLMWGECTHVFHMHCIIKWLGTQASKQQCPMDRRPWVTAAQGNNADAPSAPPVTAMLTDPIA